MWNKNMNEFYYEFRTVGKEIVYWKYLKWQLVKRGRKVLLKFEAMSPLFEALIDQVVCSCGVATLYKLWKWLEYLKTR